MTSADRLDVTRFVTSDSVHFFRPTQANTTPTALRDDDNTYYPLLSLSLSLDNVPMATVPSTSLLSRTRSGRLPTGKSATALGHDPVIAHATAAATGPGPASQIPIATSHVSVFLTNLRLLDLDLRPDWPNITARTFVVKDATQGQKRRIQSVEWALYHLFCLWDPDEARSVCLP